MGWEGWEGAKARGVWGLLAHPRRAVLPAAPTPASLPYPCLALPLLPILHGPQLPHDIPDFLFSRPSFLGRPQEVAVLAADGASARFVWRVSLSSNGCWMTSGILSAQDAAAALLQAPH